MKVATELLCECAASRGWSLVQRETHHLASLKKGKVSLYEKMNDQERSNATGDELMDGTGGEARALVARTDPCTKARPVPIETVVLDVLRMLGIEHVDASPYLDLLRKNLVLTSDQLLLLAPGMLARVGLPIVLENGLLDYIHQHNPTSTLKETSILHTSLAPTQYQLEDTRHKPTPYRHDSLHQTAPPTRITHASTSTDSLPSSDTTPKPMTAPNTPVKAGWEMLKMNTRLEDSSEPSSPRTPWERRNDINQINHPSISSAPQTPNPIRAKLLSAASSARSRSAVALKSSPPMTSADPHNEIEGVLQDKDTWNSKYLQLTERGRELVRRSWAALYSLPSETIELFYDKVYDRLTHQDDLAKLIFEARGKSSSQCTLSTMFTLILNALDHPEQLPMLIPRFGVSHFIMGVQMRNYTFMVSAFVTSLEEVLGPTVIDCATREAWTGLLTRIAELFTQEYERVDRGICGWLHLRHGGKWKFHYVRLTPCKLLLYKTDKDAVPKVAFELADMNETVSVLDACKTDPTHFKFGFRLLSGKQKQLCATTQESRQLWIQDLEHRLGFHATMRTVRALQESSGRNRLEQHDMYP